MSSHHQCTESHVLVLQAAEAAKRKAEEELQKVRAEASAAAEQAAVQVAASKALAKSAEAALAAKSTEVTVHSKFVSCIQKWSRSLYHSPFMGLRLAS